MTQSTEFFSGSIRENLRIAKSEVMEELIDSLKKVSVFEYVNRLKEGLDT